MPPEKISSILCRDGGKSLQVRIADSLERATSPSNIAHAEIDCTKPIRPGFAFGDRR
jgi:hypothetical protein